jgi:hypothetical protein
VAQLEAMVQELVHLVGGLSVEALQRQAEATGGNPRGGR